MTVYLVDRTLPGITIEQLAAAQGAAIATTEQFRAAGRDVQKHASEAHNLTLNDEQVRAMMFIEQDDAKP